MKAESHKIHTFKWSQKKDSPWSFPECGLDKSKGETGTGVSRSFLFFHFLRYLRRAPAASYFGNVVVETFQSTRHFAMLIPPQLID